MFLNFLRSTSCFGKESWGIYYARSGDSVDREPCPPPLSIHVRPRRCSELKVAQIKEMADSEESTRKTSVEDETCKMEGAECKEGDRGYYVMWDFRFLFLFRDEKQSEFLQGVAFVTSLHSCASSLYYFPLLSFLAAVVVVVVVLIASIYLSIFSLIRIPLTTHRNGLCAVYRCRR